MATPRRLLLILAVASVFPQFESRPTESDSNQERANSTADGVQERLFFSMGLGGQGQFPSPGLPFPLARAVLPPAAMQNRRSMLTPSLIQQRPPMLPPPPLMQQQPPLPGQPPVMQQLPQMMQQQPPPPPQMQQRSASPQQQPPPPPSQTHPPASQPPPQQGHRHKHIHHMG